MDIIKTTEYQNLPFIVSEIEDRVGGGSVKIGSLDKTKKSIRPGFFVGEDDKGLMQLLVSGVLVEDANDTDVAFKVRKRTQFAVGKFIAGDAEDSKAYAITKIEEKEDYDVITVGTALGVDMEAGEALYEVIAEDAIGGQGEIPITPIGVAKNEVDLTGSHPQTGVLLRGTCRVETMAFGAPSAYTKHLPYIRFEYSNK